MKDHTRPYTGLISTTEKFQYFMERTEKDFEQIQETLGEFKEDVKAIGKKIESLSNFKFMLIGGSMAVSSIVTVVLNFVLKMKS